MKLHIPQDKVIVGYVGRLVEEKGVQDLVEAVALLGPEHRQKVKFLILGNGPYKDQLDSMISTMGLQDLFDFRSFVPSSEVASYMHSFNALCLPSRTRPNWKEQFGRVLVEAMEAESLVIGSSSGEIPRVIGEDGIVFEENSPQSLKQALVLFIDDHDLTKRLTSSAKRKAKLKYTHEAIASDFFRYFAEILGQRSLK
jgi:glycosyltransferase involved in cell wall biosynthesis